jgi:hypothetical protein
LSCINLKNTQKYSYIEYKTIKINQQMKTLISKVKPKITTSIVAFISLLLLQFIVFENVYGQTFCPTSINYTDDFTGNPASIPANTAENGKATITESATIATFVETIGCTITSQSKAMTVRNGSYAPVNAQFVKTNYIGAGIDVFTAAKIRWVICNYGTLGVAECCAIGQITGTGVESAGCSWGNSIIAALNAANPQPNGSEAYLTFYKHTSSSYYTYVKWLCVQPPPAILGDLVWNDFNRDGIQQVGEPGIAGATVTLTKPDGTTAVTFTDANGAYNFFTLAHVYTQGTYTVTFTPPLYYNTVTVSNAGGNDLLDSDPINGIVSGITLLAGEVNNSIDAGFYQVNISVGNYIWDDFNKNGIKDSGEPGINGAIVKLYEDSNNDNIADGAALFSTTTASNGFYSFNNMPASTYIVGVNIPAGYTVIATNGGDPDNNIDNDNNGVNISVAGEVRSLGITIADGTEPTNDGDGYDGNQTVDFGFVRPGSIGNVVWYDKNSNGIKDVGESGIDAMVFVNLYADANNDNIADGAAIATTATAGSIPYNFNNLPYGNYIVGIVIPTGYVAVNINGGDPDNNIDNDNNGMNTSVAGEVRSNAVTIFANSEPTTDGDDANGNLTVDFALTGTSALGNFVWYDLNANGLQDAGEPGIPNVKVNLMSMNSSDSTTTDANGYYYFPNIPSGQMGGSSYAVVFNTPVGFTPSPSNSGANDNLDSDPFYTSSSQGMVMVSLASGQIDNSIDAGFYLANEMSLGNNIWYDKNNNGVKEAGEPGIAGVAVMLYKDENNDNQADAGGYIGTSTTDASGIYTFTGLNPGNYIVLSSIPTGYSAVTTNGGDPDNNIDNDNNGISILTHPGYFASNSITLILTTEPTVDGDNNNGNQTVDFGFTGTASIGDFVWYDTNRNGIQDGTEAGIANIIVTLTLPDATMVNTITNSLGGYKFDNLLAGIYSVAFSTPVGMVATQSNVTTAGATDLNDSDPIAGVVSGIAITLGDANISVDAGFHNTCTGTITGNVWHDVDGMNDNLVDSVGQAASQTPIPVGLKINLVSIATGKVVRTTTVLGNGRFSIAGVFPGTYVVVVSTIAGTIGANPPTSSLPEGWFNTGEHVGLTSGGDPLTNGRLTITNTYECLANINFGIQLINGDQPSP